MNPTKLSASVLKKLKQETVVQKPKWQFVLKTILLCLGGLVFLILGILAAAVVTIFMTDLYLFRIFDESFVIGLNALFIGLPLFWISVLVGLGFLASYILKQSETGYRHPLWIWLLGIFLAQVVGGVILAESNFGIHLERGMQNEIFKSQNLTEFRDRVSRRSPAGILAGKVTDDSACIDRQNCLIELSTMKQKVWRVDISAAKIHPRVTPSLGTRLRIIGKEIDRDTFEASQVIPFKRDRSGGRPDGPRPPR